MHEHSAALLEQERAENDAMWSGVNVTEPLNVVMHAKSWKSWDEHVGSIKGKRILDVGCGAGLWTVWLASQGATVVGIDLSPVGVAKTLERGRHHGLADRVSAYCMDVTRLEDVIARESMDLALGFSVLHHLPVDEFGRSLRAVLKPGGRAIFFENSAANPLYRLGRKIRNRETAAGSPLTAAEAQALIAGVGAGQLVYPHFKFFDAFKKYVFQDSKTFASAMQALDDGIDRIPGMRRWSAGMWVVAHKSTSA